MNNKLIIGEKYYYEQIGSNAIITGTLINKNTFKRDKKIINITWYEKISNIRRELKPIKQLK